MKTLICIGYSCVRATIVNHPISYNYRIINTNLYIQILDYFLYFNTLTFQDQPVKNFMLSLPESLQNEFLYTMILHNVNVDTDTLL